MPRALLAAATLLALVSLAHADVIVRAPGVRVQIGNGPARLPQPQPPIVLGEPPPVPLPPPTMLNPPVAIAVLTPEQFAQTFHPSPAGGNYEVVLLHPRTCQPVKVCFGLPSGCPKRIVFRGDQLVIRYGLCKAVFITFCRNGTVAVRD
jgi:hypothetical protein